MNEFVLLVLMPALWIYVMYWVVRLGVRHAIRDTRGERQLDQVCEMAGSGHVATSGDSLV